MFLFFPTLENTALLSTADCGLHRVNVLQLFKGRFTFSNTHCVHYRYRQKLRQTAAGALRADKESESEICRHFKKSETLDLRPVFVKRSLDGSLKFQLQMIQKMCSV